jgi:D-alanyl-D-alanine carboxypeptidase (penicillin-binding protein 5/6)
MSSASSHRAARRGPLATLVVAGVAVILVLSFAAGAAGLAAGPPPTPVPPSGSPSPFPQSLDTPPPSTVSAPRIDAAAAVLVDARMGQALYARAASVPRAVASLTKVMTALVTVRARRLTHIVTVGADSTRETGSVLGLHAGERISVGSLLEALLLQSSNDAATALAEDISGSEDAFVERMNARARQLGMLDTRFASASGLDDRGFSSAADLATLARAALGNPELAPIMRTKFATIANPDGPARHVQNRNALLWLYPGTIGVKTGYTSRAGNCLIAAASRNGRTLVAVVLGDGDEALFDDAAALLNYGFHAFRRSTVVRAGAPVGSLRIGGVDVAALAAASLSAWVRTDRAGDAVARLEAEPHLTLPVAAGQPIGAAVLLDHGVTVGRVRVVAAAAVAAPPPPTTVPPPSPPPTGPVPAAGPLDLIGSLLRATFGALL